MYRALPASGALLNGVNMTNVAMAPVQQASAVQGCSAFSNQWIVNAC